MLVFKNEAEDAVSDRFLLLVFEHLEAFDPKGEGSLFESQFAVLVVALEDHRLLHLPAAARLRRGGVWSDIRDNRKDCQ